MKLLVIGSGGREHAMAWRLAQNPGLQKVYVAPGNAGTARERRLKNVNLSDPVALACFAEREGVHLTVVGPEAPLAAGVVDVFRARGLKIFGPTREAAQLESSKDFAKRFMARHHIPTAEFATFSESTAAHAYIDERGAPIVIKADGLAAGKGVVVAMSLEEAHAAIDDMLSGNKLGDAGARVVIEEYLEGEEASFIVMVDGKNVLALASSQDHKRIFDGDQGPNTGGMGAFSPTPEVSAELLATVERDVLVPAVRELARRGKPFRGALYAGLMLTPAGPRVLEFNARLGDPETQPLMMRLAGDVVPVLLAAARGDLSGVALEVDRRAAAGLVLAAEHYPAKPAAGDVIEGADGPFEPDVQVFHAGTALDAQGRLVTAGGRVLTVCALGEGVADAAARAYTAAARIHFRGVQYRRDIGKRS